MDKIDFRICPERHPDEKSQKQSQVPYAKHELEINNAYISGYVALNRNPLVIDNVYHLPRGCSLHINRSFDKSSCLPYPVDVASVPLTTTEDKITGVLQIINARDGEGAVVPFSKEDEILVSLFANQAAIAIERARMTREIILRMIKMAELRDPFRDRAPRYPCGHLCDRAVTRAGLLKRNIPEKEIKRVKDILKIAAMLHDVGKVAIADAILKRMPA